MARIDIQYFYRYCTIPYILSFATLEIMRSSFTLRILSLYQQTYLASPCTGKFTCHIQRVYRTADWLCEPGDLKLILLTFQTVYFSQ